MSVPLVLSAQAILKPRPGGLSLLNNAAEINAANLRKFCADPANIKKAVDEFKNAGFSVSSIGKSSIGIMGPTYLFEQTFKVIIVTDDTGYFTVKNSARIGLIEPNGFLGGVLELVLLNQENEQDYGYWGSNPPAKDMSKVCSNYPEDIPEILGFDKPILFDKMKAILGVLLKRNDYTVIINVVDSGYYPHSYFKKYSDLKVSYHFDKVAAEKYEHTTKEEYKKLEDLETVLKTIQRESKDEDITKHKLFAQVKETKAIPFAIMMDISIVDTKRHLSDYLAGGSLASALKVLREKLTEIRVFNGKEDKKLCHGTRVIANLFPILTLIDPSRVKIRIHRDTPGYHPNVFFERFNIVPELKIKENELHIINCSYGTLQDWGGKETPEHVMELHKIIACAADKAIVLCASGNKIGESEKYRSVQAQFAEVISVGGAYKNGSEIIASDYAHGYMSTFIKDIPRVVPDICGLCGPVGNDDDYTGGVVWLPYFDYLMDKEGWLSTGGTSYATPQVAAVCGILKLMKPYITTKELKEIFKSGPNKIEGSEFFAPPGCEKVKPGDIGLINIPASIMSVFRELSTNSKK